MPLSKEHIERSINNAILALEDHDTRGSAQDAQKTHFRPA